MNIQRIHRRLETAMFDRASVYTLKWSWFPVIRVEATFLTDDGRQGHVIFVSPKDSDAHKIAIVCEFYIDGTIGITGGGDAIRIFATVLKAIRDFVRKMFERAFPDRQLHSIKLEAAMHLQDLVHKREGSRARLYTRMAKRFAPRLGFKLKKYRSEHNRRNMVFLFERVPSAETARMANLFAK